MALKRKKLDAICAHLKKTSAIDVSAVTQNGVENELPFSNGNSTKDGTKVTPTNNNEETATDLNENPELLPDPDLPVDNGVVQGTSGEGNEPSKEPSQASEYVPGANCVTDTPSTSSGNSTSATDAFTPIPPQPTNCSSVVAPTIPVPSAQPSGSGRRKSRKAAKPRIVFQATEQLSSDEEDYQESEIPESTEPIIKAPSLPDGVAETSGLDSSDKLSYDLLTEAGSSFSGFASQYLHSEQQQQHNESIEQFTDPSPADSPSSNLISVPLDLSTSKLSDSAENLSVYVPYPDNESKDTGSFSTFPSSKTSPPNPGQAVPMLVTAEAEGLADYATNTMNELLSIYGFGTAGLDGGEKQLVKKKQDVAVIARTSATSSGKQLIIPPAHQGKGVGGSLPVKRSHHSQALQKALLSASTLSVSGGTASAGAREGQGSSEVKPSIKVNRPLSTKFKFHNVKPHHKHIHLGGANVQVHKISASDYNKYIRKFHNGTECGGNHCRDLGYRDHYHCHDCNFKVFIKKEEMIRHYKWHKKRDESLQHGFLRFSPLDDCSIKYGNCTHNKRQTHYHCIQSGCDKVYVSTSDVQMHANYHRKDSAIIQEGFQRFRATEDCGTTTCGFYGLRTTHFHCRRSNCNFTFKHKADMEKHKSYHQKDEILGRDGFKKFMKYEHCSYNGCRYSKASNHIHCIRPGCNYVLHSTAQLYSHKRKHERREFENLYRTFRQSQQSQLNTTNIAGQPSPQPQHVKVSAVATNSLGSKVNLTSIPLQGYGEPMVAGTVVGNQLLQHMPIPIKMESRSGTVLAPNVTVVSAGAQTAPVASHTSVAVAHPLALTTSSASQRNNVEPTSLKSESIQAVTHLPDSITHKSESSHRQEPDSVHIKQEPESEAESDTDLPSMSRTPAAPSQPSSFVSQLDNVKSENLSDSLNLSIPAQQTSKASEESVKPAVFKTMSDASIGVDTSSSVGPVFILRPPMKKPGAPEKRERDESWKNFLIRYTANDPCHSRCQLLYKDHYHCKISGCQVLFRSKDGVREHAKFHDVQERISPMVYVKYDSKQACPTEDCQYSRKLAHFHCNWTGCNHAVPENGQTFARLEHYRIHEYAKVSAGKNYRVPTSQSSGRSEDLSQRRRGRPPKYPRLDVPLVPKVDLTEQEIRDSTVKSGEGEEAGGAEILNGFKKFDVGDLCPDDHCMYRSQLHYHCGRPRCHTSTNRIDVLNLHAKDFHSFVNILESFEFFDRNVDCRRGHCNNNRTNRHFHCTHPRCDYSFVRHSTMAQHYKKHHPDASTVGKPASVTAANSSNTSSPLSPGPRITPIQLLRRPDGQAYIPIVPAPAALDKSVVKAAGTFYPLSGLPTAVSGTPVSMITSQGQPLTSALTLAIPANLVSGGIPVMTPMPSGTVVSTTTNIMPVIAGNLVAGSGPTVTTAPPLTVLLQQKPGNGMPQPSWSSMRSSMHFNPQASCGRPFCKLKKKDHYHCLECNQAFSDPARLRGHISKHGVKFKKLSQAHSNAAPTTVPFVKMQAQEQPPVEMGLDLSTNKGKEVQAIKVTECTETEKYAKDEVTEDDNDSLSSSLNLSMGKITNCLTAGDNGSLDLSMSSSERPLIIDEQANHSEDESAISEVNLNGNHDDESQSDMSLSASTSITSSPNMSRRSGRKRTAPNHSDFVSSDDASLMAKQMKLKLSAPIPSSVPVAPITTTASSVPEGFLRFKCGTDCCYVSCNYRHSVSHFHCLRTECGYGFSDKSRIENHLDRHKRLDKLMGEEFRQYRATVGCGRGDCEFSKKASHFHCEKCTFVCADSSKVLAHRKFHAKMDNIIKNGFQKFGALQSCDVLMCGYSRKQTHYHCIQEGCNHAVLGPAQMAPHKLKHASHDV